MRPAPRTGATAPGVGFRRAAAAVADALARDRFASFVRLAWPLLNPRTALVWNWHIDALAEHLEAVSRGQIAQLVITVPPGYSKSTLVSQCWPAWEWLQHPERRWAFAAYGATLSTRDNLKRRMLIESDWYRQAFTPDWSLAPDRRGKTGFANTFEGEMVATSVGGAATGFHFDRLVGDDLMKAADIYTARLAQATQWFVETFESRARDGASKVLIMQRLHKRDPAGAMLARGDWEHLDLPERLVLERRCRTSIGWQDPRTTEGELLNPVRFPPARVDAIWKGLGSAAASAQRQQSPTAGDGNIFERRWWRHWTEIPDEVDEIVGSWDCTFKKADGSDFVAGLVMARKGADFYLLPDLVHARMGFVETERAIVALASKYTECGRWLVELAANGHGLVETLRPKLPGVVGVDVAKLGGKVARAAYVSPTVESGNVYLPPLTVDWVERFIEELASFPRGEHDDQVDAFTQALRDLLTREATFTLPDPVERDATTPARMESQARKDAQRRAADGRGPVAIVSARLPPGT